MKTFSTTLITLAFLAPAVVVADNAAPVVQNEYAKQQVQLEAQLMKAKRALRDLEAQREKAMNDSKAQGQNDLVGVRTLKRYDTLMTSRYATEQGEFQNWRPLSPQDVENINKLLDTYLRARPLTGRVSAGEAHRTLDWAMGRLEQLAKMHNKPDVENNSDLEILAHQIKETETTVKAVMASADRLGIKLNPKPEESAENRLPASAPEPTKTAEE